MLALRGQDEHPESAYYLPNVLPCRIHSSGPAKVTKRFWSPVHNNDKSKTSYFRGRRLRGKTMKLPPGYVGIAAQATERLLPQEPRQPSDDAGSNESGSDAEGRDLDDKPETVKILQSTAEFDEITVWGHDMLPAADDPFVKGVEEWISFAEAIHVQPPALESHTTIAAGGQPTS